MTARVSLMGLLVHPTSQTTLIPNGPALWDRITARVRTMSLLGLLVHPTHPLRLTQMDNGMLNAKVILTIRMLVVSMLTSHAYLLLLGDS